nr:hypothetical protein GTC16762_03640 [Pigmentibacter ruber]
MILNDERIFSSAKRELGIFSCFFLLHATIETTINKMMAKYFITDLSIFMTFINAIILFNLITKNFHKKNIRD